MLCWALQVLRFWLAQMLCPNELLSGRTARIADGGAVLWCGRQLWPALQATWCIAYCDGNWLGHRLNNIVDPSGVVD